MIDEFGRNFKINVCVLDEIVSWQFTGKTVENIGELLLQYSITRWK
jgi:hypothetical protein